MSILLDLDFKCVSVGEAEVSILKYIAALVEKI